MKELQELTVSSEIRDGSTSRVGALESDTARVGSWLLITLRDFAEIISLTFNYII